MAEFMTVEEVAVYLRVTKKTIYRLLWRGNIPATKIGHRWRFSKASIDEWIEQRSVGRDTSILVIDDEEIIRGLFKEALEIQGHRVMTAKDGAEGLKMAKQWDFDLVFLDLKMPGMDGAELFRQIKTMKPDLLVVIITAYPESDIMARALAYGPFGIIKKPFSELEIVTAVNSVFQLGKASGKRSLSRGRNLSVK